MNTLEQLPIEVFYASLLQWPYRTAGEPTIRTEVDGRAIRMVVHMSAVREGGMDELVGIVRAWFGGRPHRIRHDLDGDRLTLRVFVPMIPPPPDDDGRTPYPTRKTPHDAIVEHLRKEDRRFTTAQLHAVFEAPNKPEFSASTVSHALADLVKAGKLTAGVNDHYGKGYGLSEWTPG